MKIGIMGGTFDPIHNGHLLIAENARIQYQLDKVIFMPAGNPPHKRDFNLTDQKKRFEMVSIAIQGNPGFAVSKMELNTKISYTYQTLEQLRIIYPDDAFYFIIGADSLRDFETWRNPDKILECATILAAVRDDFESMQLEERILELSRKHKGTISSIKTPLFQVSSHEIRQRVRQGQSIRYLIPEEVRIYIEKNHIYS